MVKKGLDKKILITSILSLILIASVVIAVALGENSGIAVTRNDSASTTTYILYNGTFVEDVARSVNISINNTLSTVANSNVTEFNVTLPTGFTYVTATSLCPSVAAGENCTFTNTSSVLKWISNSTAGLISSIITTNLSSYLSFNIIVANPGAFNMTLRWRNGTNSQTENITFIVNDTTAPTRSWASNTYANYSNHSKYGIVANITITDNWATELNMPNVSAINANATINITLMNVTFGILNSSSGNYFLLNTTASLYVNFTNSTGLADGTYYLNASVNDSSGNLNFTTILRRVTLDRTAPTITFSCSPNADINVGEAVTCTCSGNDSQNLPIAQTSDILTTTYNTTGYSSASGTATETCTIVDRVGNTASSVITYTVYASGPAEGSGSSGGSSTSTYTTALFPTAEQLSSGSGYTGQLKAKQKAKLDLNDNAPHYIAVDSITTTAVSITISSTPQTASLTVGSTKKFDVNADGYYDLSVTLNKIQNAKADLTMLAISEQILENSTITEDEETTSSQDNATTGTDDKTGFSWSTIIWIIVLLAIIVGVWILLKKRE